MSDYQYIDARREGAALVATLNNPPKNFLNAPMVVELTNLVAAVAEDPEVRALVFTGGVDGIFITHYDVGELTTLSDRLPETSGDPGAPGDFHPMNKLLLAIQELPQPVIAAINGTVMGGGCELSLACDFRYMAKGPYVIGLPEVRVGILPGAGGTQRMTRLLGTAKALELMLLGNTLDPESAERVGLVHRAVEPDRLLPEALALAAELAQGPATSIAMIKQCILKGSEMPLLEGLKFEQAAFWKTMRSEDAGRLMKRYLKSEDRLDQQ
jgi:enoyl-CoA hydratase